MDRDHQIGHSYFMDATSAKQAARRALPAGSSRSFRSTSTTISGAQALSWASARSRPYPRASSRSWKEYRRVYGEEPLEDEAPWEFHEYPDDQLEEALRNTFVTTGYSRSMAASKLIRCREYETLSYELLGEDAIRRLETYGSDSASPFSLLQDARPGPAVRRRRQGRKRDGPDPAQDLRSGGAITSAFSSSCSATRRQPAPQAGGADRLREAARLLPRDLDPSLRLGAQPPAAHPAQAPLRRGGRAHGFLRGKLLAERELAGTATLTARYACRYEIFTPDHLLNQILKFCNKLLLGQAREPLDQDRCSKRTRPGSPRCRTAGLCRGGPEHACT